MKIDIFFEVFFCKLPLDGALYGNKIGCFQLCSLSEGYQLSFLLCSVPFKKRSLINMAPELVGEMVGVFISKPNGPSFYLILHIEGCPNTTH